MNVWDVTEISIVVLLGAYLTAALLKPEWFA